jgi:hypothetical protein
MNFMTVILAAFGAAILSAQLAGGLIGSAASGPLSLIAPLPLLLVGFFTLPLAALASALIGAALIGLTSGGLSGIAFLALVGLPAFAATWLALIRGSGSAFGKDGYLDAGVLAFFLMIVVSFGAVFAQLLVNADFAAFDAARRALSMATVEAFLAEMPEARTALSRDTLAQSLAMFGPALSMLFIEAVLLFLVWLAARMAKRWNRFQRPWPDFSLSSLPPGAFVVFGAAALLAYFGGWAGLFGGFVLGGMLLLSILAGLAVVHHHAKSNPRASWMVPAAWFALLILSPFTAMVPALLIAGLGIADHLFDMRELRRKTP